MLLALLWGGRSSIEEIARSILAHDESQVEYYEKVTKNMVGRVLRRHGIVEKDKAGYSISGYDDLHAEQIAGLIDLCESKLEEYEKRRGGRIWQHRRASVGYAPGALRYEVLKRARFRCELCGVPALAGVHERLETVGEPRAEPLPDGERAHVAHRFSEPAFHDLFLAPADVFALRSVLGLDKVAEGIASDLEIETLSITSRLKGKGSL
jgi:hypothetical protein